MTSKADRLRKVVDEVTCVKCRVNPRFVAAMQAVFAGRR
jgi:hypothetical protein